MDLSILLLTDDELSCLGPPRKLGLEADMICTPDQQNTPNLEGLQNVTGGH